jgi:hypothetical protein
MTPVAVEASGDEDALEQYESVAKDGRLLFIQVDTRAARRGETKQGDRERSR